MKKDTPATSTIEYHTNAKVTCACGNTFTVGSTKAELNIEICSLCHPFYTGKQKLVDTARRIEKFQERAAKMEQTAAERKGRKSKRVRATSRKKEAKKVKVEKNSGEK
ncbi:MAG: 50S ribosomal protein L31 [Candidatus Buchananbacteria bacterium RIFCSPHIGHO2_01_FULL_47_11b]|uniref:50S ribosomal protein L31 n=1 Tax=Candidatus Buchananbacteria bacterium RIFCSPHIGHO2_01_FULL_47_11b TaxID=1797537 RepID=A0A1G1Y5M5_9BACT|nr:MAG: 50S ribosomal protein L31 [Candidatus Buchananbacteria bacterium RIFCSPHIGHO2_01_FULL_47_11b]